MTAKATQKLSPAKLAIRNQQIMQCHVVPGATNAEIGHRFDLHPGQVARIIRQGKAVTAIDQDNDTHEERALRSLGKRKPLPLPNPSHVAGVKEESIRLKRLGNRAKRMSKVAKAAVVSHKRRTGRERKGNGSRPMGMSLLDASVLVLQRRIPNTGLHPKELVELAIAKGYWKPLKGATPFATVWSRILVEMKTPSTSRFKQTGPGCFALTAVGRKWVAE